MSVMAVLLAHFNGGHVVRLRERGDIGVQLTASRCNTAHAVPFSSPGDTLRRSRGPSCKGTARACYRKAGRQIPWSKLGSCLEVYVQLNVYRSVVVDRAPAQGTLDSAALQPRFARWALAAADAG
jgi:hypothetical protein